MKLNAFYNKYFSIFAFQIGDDKAQRKSLDFIDLNDDVVLQILEKFPFADLVSFAGISEYYLSLAQNVFKRRYSDRLFEVSPGKELPEMDLKDVDNMIYLQELNTVQNVLEKFGKFIRKLQVHYGNMRFGYAVDHRRTMDAVNRLVNLHCANTVTHLIVHDNGDHFFKLMENPFTRVEYLAVFGHHNNPNGVNITFGDMFPALRNLSLPATLIDQSDSIDRHFEHLVELNASFYEYSQTHGHHHVIPENVIKSILIKNPQIRSLKVRELSATLLEVANDVLPKLEHLCIAQSTLFDEIFRTKSKIIIKSVKNLKLLYAVSQMPSNIEFKNLEELHVTIDSGSDSGWWIDFIAKNPQLTKFGINNGCVDDTALLRFASVNSNLTDYSMALCANVQHLTVVHFVKNNWNVDKFHFTRNEHTDDVLLRTAEALQNQTTHFRTVTHTPDDIVLEK